ncbi:MFS transporter [Desulfosarcina ovata]|uniref:MFS transporter n=1 Tax=Desulfosarcina ovata subsp. ovata TaxID=2752305 RepID=A0A5K8A3T9_9BACT|nr:MFS transporter [Desulfosarcina ovata]BBO87096.1 MFS transporter [Desulfosarcina ovata subsp. ovata]
MSDRKWISFVLVATGVFMTTLDSSIVNIALPVIMERLKAPFETVQWIVVIYLLTISSSLLAFGRLSDIRGRRWVYCYGFIGFTLGSLFCALATQAWHLIFSRAFQGVGAAMIMACSPALVVDTFPYKERGKALGLVGTVVATGLTAGPALGGLILAHFSWRMIFFLNIPIGIAAVVAAQKILSGTTADRASREPFDWWGAIWLAVTLFSLMTFMLHVGKWPASSLRMLALAVLAMAGLILLVWVERQCPYPILDGSILKNRFFIVSVGCAMILFAGLFSIIFLMPFYLMRPAGLSAQAAGYLMMIPFVFLFFFSPLSGWLSDRIGSKLLCFAGMGGLTTALIAFGDLTPSAGRLAEMWRLGLAGVSVAIFLPAYNASAMGSVVPQKRGIASGIIAAARNFGMVIGVALSGLIFSHSFSQLSGGLNANSYQPLLKPVFLRAFHLSMLAGAGLVAAGWLLTLFRGTPPTDS